MVSSQVVFLFLSSLLLFSTASWLRGRLSAVSWWAVRLFALWLWWAPAVSLHRLLGRSKLPCWAVWTSDFGAIFSLVFPPPLSFPCRCLRSFWSSERQNIASFTTVSTRELKVADGCYSFQFPVQIKKKIFYLSYHSFGLFPVLRLKILFFNTSSLTACIWNRIYP